MCRTKRLGEEDGCDDPDLGKPGLRDSKQHKQIDSRAPILGDWPPAPRMGRRAIRFKLLMWSGSRAFCLCGSARLLDEAKSLIESMPFEPLSQMHRCDKLGAFRNCGDVELVNQIAYHLNVWVGHGRRMTTMLLLSK